jgi:hypothetical protein
VLAAEQALEVHVVERFLDHREGSVGLAGRIAIPLGSQLEVELRFLEVLLLFAPGGQRRAEQRAFAQQGLRGFAVAPELRRRSEDVELLNARFPPRQVKDTSRTLSSALPVQRNGP